MWPACALLALRTMARISLAGMRTAPRVKITFCSVASEVATRMACRENRGRFAIRSSTVRSMKRSAVSLRLVKMTSMPATRSTLVLGLSPLYPSNTSISSSPVNPAKSASIEISSSRDWEMSVRPRNSGQAPIML